MTKKIIILSALALIICLSVIVFSYCNRDIIPEGGTYYVGVTSNDLGDNYNYSYNETSKYEAGQFFPKRPQTGDVYVYDGYEYRYNMVLYFKIYEGDGMFEGVAAYRWMPSEQNGWNGFQLNGYTDPNSKPIENINGIPVLHIGCYYHPWHYI